MRDSTAYRLVHGEADLLPGLIIDRYGDYIAFRCLWSPHVDRYALPAVPTRNTCLPARIITK